MAKIGSEVCNGAPASISRRTWLRICTNARVPSGARFKRRNNSCLGGSTTRCKWRRLSEERIFPIGVCGAANLVRVGRKIAVQNIQKSSPDGLVERLIYSQNFLCQMSAGHAAAFRQ